jgi:serine protease Do
MSQNTIRAFLFGAISSLVLSFTVIFVLHFKGFISTADAQSTPKMNLGSPLPENLFVELAKVINPTVVNINSAHLPKRQMYRQRPQGNMNDPFFDMFQQFFGEMPQQNRAEQSLGTGFIIRADGLILTNNHVVEGADVIKVQLSEKDRVLYNAEVVGRDQRTDLALIKIDAKKQLPFARLGNSHDLQVGDWVAAFGNPLGLGHTTSKGIVSAIGREIDELNRIPFLQTDASINPGNSGGPLVNTKAEVIGVNAAIAANSQGIGFAIPIDEAKATIAALEKDGIIHHGYMGVNMYPYQINPEAAQEMGLNRLDGALIIGVMEGSPAQKAGLREYDFVVKFNGKDIDGSDSFRRAIADSPLGKPLAIELIRKGKTKKLEVTLEENPQDIKQVQAQHKTYRGQKAPFELGFSVANYSQELAAEFGVPALKKPCPIVVDVDMNSPAAKGHLSAGDVILDVNRVEVSHDTDVLKALKKDQINSLRVLRNGAPLLLYISTN